MPLSKQQKQEISDFSDQQDFILKGGLMTDLDGTVIQHQDGRYFMPEPVRLGLADMYNTHCPVVINSMRFPLSVIKTFAEDWYSISKASVPLVSLNGSQTGFIHKEKKAGFTFEETASFPLLKNEVDAFIADLDNILKSGGKPLVFYYPRDWKKGEIIWTPDKELVNEMKERYRSASQVYSGTVSKLNEDLLAEEISMIFLLPGEDPGNLARFTGLRDFYTHAGVDKLFGAKKMIAQLDRSMDHFIGAGDTPMDVFLKEVGLTLKVGTINLGFDCASPVIQIDRLDEIGEVFTELSMTCHTARSL